MDKVFKFFHVPVRLYNFTKGLTYQRNLGDLHKGRVKMFRGLVKNNHIYVLKHDINTLRQCKQTRKDLKRLLQVFLHY